MSIVAGYLGKDFEKSDGSKVSLNYATEADIIIVLHTASW